MPYTPNTPNAYDVLQIPKAVRSQYFREVLLQTPLSLFMGSGNDSLIQVVDKPAGSGQTVSFSFGREIDYKNPVIGYDQITGTGQNIKFYYDEVRVIKQALSDKLQGTRIVRQETPIPVYEALKPKLLTAHQRNLVYQILYSATFGLYTDRANTGPTANRVVYAGAGHQANINAGVNGMNTGTAYNQNGLSVAHIRKCRDMAIYGGTAFETEKRISPYMLTTRKGFPVPTYVYMMDTPSYVSLTGDPDWKNYFHRGIIESEDQPTGLSGAFYKGMIDNIMVYEVPELGNFHVTSGQTASWNLFCGAQAFGLAWGEKPWFTQEISNHGNDIEMAVQEIRGQKPLMFPSFANENVSVENGIIHSFISLG